MKPRQFIGLAILAVAAVVLVLIPTLRRSAQKLVPIRPTESTLAGKAGGEKMAFLRDPDVVRILKDRHGITLQITRAGSVDLVLEPPTGMQFLWPASPLQVELFRRGGGQDHGVEDIFNSPLVVYSWKPVADALVQAGVVKLNGTTHYLEGFAQLVQWIELGRKWKDVGLPQLYGRVSITATDPLHSNSGLSFAGLVANQLNRGEVVTVAEADSIVPLVSHIFESMGFLEQSSGTLFEKYLNQGMGAFPLVVGYENQLVEFSLEHPDLAPRIRQEVVVLYPQPTTWASHPLIALTKEARRLSEALKTDKELMRIALERHGFRSALQNDPRVLATLGLPEQITAVQQLPSSSVMNSILTKLRDR